MEIEVPESYLKLATGHEDAPISYLKNDAGFERAYSENLLGAWGIKRVIRSLENGNELDADEQGVLDEAFDGWTLEDFKCLGDFYKKKKEEREKKATLEEVLRSLRLPSTATKEEVLDAVAKLF